MRLLLVLLLALAFVALVSSQAPACTRVIARKEVRAMSSLEWSRFVVAFYYLRLYGWIDWFAYVHFLYFFYIHNNSFLLPFHRLLLNKFEETADAFSPGVFIPYYDLTRDFANPAASEVLSAKYYGGDGRGGCVNSGIQNGLDLNWPERVCLTRQYNGGPNYINPWYTPEYVSSILQTAILYDQLRSRMEYSIHGGLHLSLGGTMLTYASNNDMIFYAHHANLDRLWAKWQQNPAFANLIDGLTPFNTPVTLSTLLPQFNNPISDVMRLGYGTSCHSYVENSVTNAARSSKFRLEDSDVGTVANNTITAQLPADVLARFFPKSANGSASAHDLDLPKEGAKPLAEILSMKESLPTDRPTTEADSVTPSPPVQNDQVQNDQNPAANQQEPASSSESSDTSDSSQDSSSDTSSESVPKMARRQVSNAAIGKLPLPVPTPEHFIVMHKYDPVAVKAVFDEATEFVNVLNSVGYISPYA